MKINFNHVDKEYYGIEEYVKPVVDTSIVDERFVQILCTILNTYNKYSEHIVNDVDKALKLFRNFYAEDLTETELMAYESFHKATYDFYWSIVDDEFGNKIKQFNEDLYKEEHLRFADNRLARYRGLLFEKLVYEEVKPRFANSLFDEGCRIYINGVRVIARYGRGNASHKETIDIAGWDESVSYGEFYECKINPIRFEVQNYKYFMELKQELDKNKIHHYIIALVCADARANLCVQKKSIEEENPGCNIEFEIIGREDIYKIKNYLIPTTGIA